MCVCVCVCVFVFCFVSFFLDLKIVFQFHQFWPSMHYVISPRPLPHPLTFTGMNDTTIPEK